MSVIANPFWKKVTLCVSVLVAQLCSTLCDPMDCSLPGSSVHGIFQARMLEWGAIPTSKGNNKQNLKLSLQLFVYNEWHSFRYYQIYQEIKPNDQQRGGKQTLQLAEWVLVTQLYPALVTPWIIASRLPCPWDFPGKNTGVGCHFFLHSQQRQTVSMKSMINMLRNLKTGWRFYKMTRVYKKEPNGSSGTQNTKLDLKILLQLKKELVEWKIGQKNISRQSLQRRKRKI